MDLTTVMEYEAMVKLNLPESEREWIAEKASMLEASFKELSEIDTDGVEPLVSVLEFESALREDVSVKLLPREEILSNSPEQYDGYFQVPRTIE